MTSQKSKIASHTCVFTVDRNKVSTIVLSAILCLSLITVFAVNVKQVSAATIVNSGWEQSEGTDNTDNETWTADSYSVVNSTTKVSGAYSIDVYGYDRYVQTNFSGLASGYFRVFWRQDSNTSTSYSNMIRLLDADDNPIIYGQIAPGRIDLMLYPDDNNYAFDWQADTWYNLTIGYNAPTEGYQCMWLDDVLVKNISATMTTAIAAMQLGFTFSDETGHVYFDDVAVTDGSALPEPPTQPPPTTVPQNEQVQIKHQKTGETGYINSYWSILGSATLNQSILCWNNTLSGEFENNTLPLSGSSGWANFSATMPANGTIIRGWVYGENNLGEWNQTGNFTYQVYDNDMALYVDGNRILNGADELVSSWSGLNYADFLNNPYGNWILPNGTILWNTWSTEAVDYNFNAWNAWSAKIIRTHLSVEDIYNQTFIDNYTYFLNKCFENDMYVIVDFYSTNKTSSPRLPYPPYDYNQFIDSPETFAELWGNITRDFRSYPNLIFDPWNEPLNNDTVALASYQNCLQLCINATREYSNHIVTYQQGVAYRKTPEMYEGMGWNLYPVTDVLGNLRYDAHIYRSNFFNTTYGGSNNLYSYADMDRAFNYTGIWTIADSYPFGVGEIGYDMLQADGYETEWYNATCTLLQDRNIGFVGWWWKGSSQQYALLTDNENYEPTVGGVLLQGFLGGANYTGTTYVTVVDWVSPLAQQYNSSTVGFEVSTVGSNDTGVALQIQLYNESGAVYPENFTSATGSFTGLTNGTYTAAVYAVGEHGAADYETVVFTVAIPDVYTLTVSINSPANTTYTSGIVAYSVSSSGNETGVTYQINAYLNSVAVGSNKTAVSGSFIGLSNGTYTFAVYAVGTHGTETYETVVFTVSITTSEDAPVLTIVSPFNSTYITSTFNVEITYTGTAALIWFNVKNGSSWVYESNTTYTAATSLTGYADGTYTFYAFAINNEGETDEESTVFTVGIIANPILPQVNVDTYWLFLQEGDFLGAVQALLVSTFLSFEAAIAMIVMLFMIPIYLRTKSLLLLSILWILIGSFFVVAVPMASGIGILFIALAIGGLLWRLFRPSGYG